MLDIGGVRGDHFENVGRVVDGGRQKDPLVVFDGGDEGGGGVKYAGDALHGFVEQIMCDCLRSLHLSSVWTHLGIRPDDFICISCNLHHFAIESISLHHQHVPQVLLPADQQLQMVATTEQMLMYSAKPRSHFGMDDTDAKLPRKRPRLMK